MIGLSFLFFVPGYRNKIYSYFCYLNKRGSIKWECDLKSRPH